MITEDYCGFEVAKLLKEKGFDVYGDGSFGSSIEIHREYSPNGKTINTLYGASPHKKAYPAPTHQMAMKWLREVYKECITVYPIVTDDDGNAGCLWQYSISKLLKTQHKSAYAYELYEQACEEAIKYCLTNLL